VLFEIVIAGSYIAVHHKDGSESGISTGYLDGKNIEIAVREGK